MDIISTTPILDEGQEKIITDHEAFKQAVSERDAADKWYGDTAGTTEKSNFYANGIEAHPLEYGEVGLKMAMAEGAFPGSSEELVKKLTVDTGLGIYLEMPCGETKVAYPVRDVAFDNLVKLAGVDCPLVTTMGHRGYRDPVDIKVRAEIVNRGLETLPMTTAGGKQGKRVKWLLRDGAVNFIGSGESENGDGYVVMPFSEILSAVPAEIERTLGKISFLEGSISHIYDTATYIVDNQTLQIKASAALELPLDKTRVGFRIASSDAGLSSATIYPIVISGSEVFYFGYPIAIEHKGKASIQELVKKVPEMFSMLMEMAQKVCDLRKEPVREPVGMYLRIAKAIGLPKKLAFDQVGLLQCLSGATQYQIYWALLQTISMWKNESKPSRIAQVQRDNALCACVIGKRFSEADGPFDWI